MEPAASPSRAPSPAWAELQAIRRTAHLTGLTLLCYLGLSTLLPLLLDWLLPARGMAGWALQLHRELLASLAYAGALLLPFFFMWKALDLGHSQPPAGQPADPPYLLAALLAGTGAASLGNLLSHQAELLARRLGWGMREAAFAPSYTLPAGLAAVLAFTLLAAVVEELVFRGVLLRALRRHGDGFAILLSAALFACCHSSPLQVPPALLSGLVLAYLAVRTGSLGLPILVHMCYNALALIINALAQGLLGGIQELFSLLAGGMLALSGAIFLFYIRARDRRLARPVLRHNPALPRSRRAAAFLGSAPLWAALALLLLQQTMRITRLE